MSPRSELKDPQREIARFRGRLAFGAGFILLLSIVLAGRFFYVQITEHAHYSTMAENNRITIVPIVPNRGLILDRNGVVLARNYSAYTLEITPSKVHNLGATIAALGRIVEISPRDRALFDKLRDESHAFQSIPIRTHLNEVEVARLAVNLYRFPGVQIKARMFRDYPLGDLAVHAVGYVGRINDSDLKRLTAQGELSNYQGTQYIGKTGIEQSYERQLHGRTGYEEVETNAVGRPVRTLSRTPPVSGDNLYLGLDARMQEIADQAFGNNRGALVAIDPHTGGILAFVSRPGYNPNLFVDGIDTVDWNALNDSPDHPLEDRVIQGLFPPGSTFKPFMAMAGLELHVITPQFQIHDPGYFQLPGQSHRYRDWKKGGHGIVDVHKAIIVSCDTFFYTLAHMMGIQNIHDFVSKFGFGSRTGIDIEGELPGLLASPTWKWKRFHQPWYPGETVITGIGQGYTLVTPMQLAYAVAMLADNGTAYRPHLVQAIQNGKTDRIKTVVPIITRDEHFDPAYEALIRDAMIHVNLPGGTAPIAWHGCPYPVAGKTGTAQLIDIGQGQNYNASKLNARLRDNGVYIAYAPADDPKIAAAAVVQNAGEGGDVAAPIVRKIFDYYLLGKVPPPPPPPATAKESPHG
ncbi:MAG: penicillin-binding protein 2 [Betaproteobacteria bacterium]|nr:penicillin-binding protein 2 [Betaproteobacteria bacterium]